MIGTNEEVIEETKRILRSLFLKNQYEVILEKTQDDTPKSGPKTQSIPSQGDKKKVDSPSILEVQLVDQVEVNDA